MARKKERESSKEDVLDLRHTGVTRLNIPPAGLTARGEIVKERKLKYAYNPHLAPTLRFDGTGGADKVKELLEEAGRRRLEPEELKLLREAFGNYEPWLEWAGKREQQWCVADPVALHIHERLSTQAILRVARRENPQRDLFLDPEQEYKEAVQFYKWPMEWTNRFILGDSLAVMASLARREALAGKVQMIYMDPPYGIRYSSNFQPEMGNRDVKDRDEDLTREPEMVKAYRDTWTLGVHSYLSYLRDRLLLCKELLADTGSIFVQMGDENLHRVRAIMDEVFGAGSFLNTITVKKKSSTSITASVADYLLWYAKDRSQVRLRQLRSGVGEPEDADKFRRIELPSGERRLAWLCSEEQRASHRSQFLREDYPVVSQDEGPRTKIITVQGRQVHPGKNRHWTYEPDVDMKRLELAERLRPGDNSAFGVVYWADSSSGALSNLWDDLHGEADPVYVVQTNWKVIERCLLLTTEPGDLVLDPTGGSGTTAYVAEKWGRRWINIDISRVAIAIARQRILREKFDYYRLRPTSAEDVDRNPNGAWLHDPEAMIQGTCTFDCETAPHVTLKSIAQNQALDPIFEKWDAHSCGKAYYP